MNYVLSDILKYSGESGLNMFIDDVYDLYSQCEHNTIVIINDANIGIKNFHVRYHYGKIEQKFASISRTLRVHFDNSHNPPYAYGRKYSANIITSNLKYDISRFNPWMECRSAQLIIAKN